MTQKVAQGLESCAQPPTPHGAAKCRSLTAHATAQVQMTVQWVPDPDAPHLDQVPGGNLHIVPSSASGLKKPDKIIRDLSTYVDYTSAYVALLCFGLYLLAGFAFYQVRVLRALAGHSRALRSASRDHASTCTYCCRACRAVP